MVTEVNDVPLQKEVSADILFLIFLFIIYYSYSENN